MPRKGQKKTLSNDRDAWWESIHIQDAFRILPPRLFGIWMTMHTLNPRQMAFGVKKLAKVYGLPYPGFTKSIMSLHDAGFISVERTGDFKPVNVRMVKRASICNSSWFVRVPVGRGRMKMTHEEEDAKFEKYGGMPNQIGDTAKEREAHRKTVERAQKQKKRDASREMMARKREELRRRVRVAKARGFRKTLVDYKIPRARVDE